MDRQQAYHYSMYLNLMGIDDSSFRGDGTYWRADASSRLAFGLCKKYGIDTKGMSPKEAWEALKEKTGKTASDYYNHSGEQGHDKVRFNTANVKTFTRSLQKAKESQSGDKKWRVSGMERKDLRKEHPNARLHVTDGGSTIAIDSNGDIVGVCKHKDDTVRGGELIAYAVKNGGNRLDSYDGNHEFYAKCGFEPVSWCKWNEQYAPTDWKGKGYNPEDVVFYKYVGKENVKIRTREDLEQWKKKVRASKDYMSAQKMRNNIFDNELRKRREKKG